MLFSGTIRDNILYGLDIAGKSEKELNIMINEAAESANALNFIKDEQFFPLGFETKVCVRGVKLSGG